MTNQLRSPLRSSLRSTFEHRRGGFNPASLASSAFYDRTVLSTLFQDSEGTTQVTATAQPIGLELDLSQGLVLGPELVVNGDFSAGATGWTNSGFTISGGKATANPSAYSSISQDISLSIAGLYELSWTAEITGGGNLTLQWATGSTVLSTGNFKRYVSLPTGAAYVSVWGANSIGTIDNISVKLLAGNHASQPTAGKRAITAGSPIYADFDAVDDDIVTTFPTSLGAGCTVCRSLPATGASITTGVTIGTTFTDNVDAHALLIFTAAQWAALSAGDISKLTDWLNKKAGL